MAKQKCAQCNAVKFRKDPDGKRVCIFGHIQEHFRVEESEGELRGRKRSKKRVKTEKHTKNRENFKGQELEWCLAQSIQIVLQRQIQAITKLLDLPVEFEQVVKELWLLYVSESVIIPSKGEGPPKLTLSQDPSTSTGLRKKSIVPDDVNHELEDEDEHEEVLQALQSPDELEEDAQEFEATPKLPSPPPIKKRVSRGLAFVNGKFEDNPKELPKFIGKKVEMRHTLCLLYIGCLYIRIPIMMVDIRRMAIKGEIPYYRVESMLPKELLEKIGLPGYKRLVQEVVPGMFEYSSDVHSFLRLYRHQFKIKIPVASYSLLTSRLLHEFCLPVQIYPVIMKMLELTGLKIVGPGRSAEVQLACIFISFLQMVYGLDEKERKDENIESLHSILPPWNVWVSMILHRKKTRGINRRLDTFRDYEELGEKFPKELIKIHLNTFSKKGYLKTKSNHREFYTLSRFLPDLTQELDTLFSESSNKVPVVPVIRTETELCKEHSISLLPGEDISYISQVDLYVAFPPRLSFVMNLVFEYVDFCYYRMFIIGPIMDHIHNLQSVWSFTLKDIQLVKDQSESRDQNSNTDVNCMTGTESELSDVMTENSLT